VNTLSKRVKKPLEEGLNLNSIELTFGKVLERLDNLIDTVGLNKTDNENQHKEIMGAVKELCGHVNHENELMHEKMNENKKAVEERVTLIEEQHQNEKAEKRGQIKIYKITIAILGIALTVVGILAGLRII
jgi:uncharacterized protein YhaN